MEGRILNCQVTGGLGVNKQNLDDAQYIEVIVYTLLIGFYGNWICYLLSGLWCAGRANYPIYGKDMPEGAAPWQDFIVTFLGLLSGLILLSAVLIAWAECKKNKE
jgi:hypothetical protein